MKICLRFDSDVDDFRKKLVIAKDWSDRDFLLIKQRILRRSEIIDSKRYDLDEVKLFLVSKRQFVLNLLENPN